MGVNRLLSNHRTYTRTVDPEELAGLSSTPRDGVAVLTCMDVRIDPARILGLELGDAHVLRNAGGRASEDAIRSLVVSVHMTAVREVMVIQHTHCAMNSHTDAEIAAVVRRETGAEPDGLPFLTFENLRDNVAADVRRIQESPYLPGNLTVSGFTYDVTTGKLSRVTG